MPDEFVTIAEFSNIAAAELARSDLERAGIRATFFELNGFPMGGGVPLKVAAADAERALAVLAKTGEHAKHPESHQHHPPVAEDSKSASDSASCFDELNRREKAADRAFYMALVGIVVPPVAFYVGWQLGSVIVSREQLSAKRRKFAIWAGALLLVDIGVLVLWLRSF